jgi:ectoine hydroxylase-related dioxygenase (phytanoyl-CoA dioxygenase family)
MSTTTLDLPATATAPAPVTAIPSPTHGPQPRLAGEARTGLTPAEAAHWREHGWVAIPDFLDRDEVALLQAEVRALQSAGKLRNVATDGDGVTHSKTAFNLQICPVGPHSRPIRALAYAAKVRSAITELLGDSAVQNLDQIFLKPARHGTGTNWHSDNGYFRSRVVEAGTGMWLAVNDANRANGTMTIVPGSHRREWAHVRDHGSDHHITCAPSVDPATALPIELPAGGALFFNYGVVHSTGPNTTDRDRAGLALHFIQEPFYTWDDANNPSRANWRRLGKASDGGQGFYGENLLGVWEGLAGASPAGRTA